MFNEKKTKLYYLVGASGSGKDSILSYFREHLADQCSSTVIVAHRYITRVTDNSENAISLSNKEFQQRLDNGLFILYWRANGLSYGIGIEVYAWLDKGVSVIVNGSRAYLSQAKKMYGKRLHSIEVQVSDEVIESRLRHRSRENHEEIEQRLQRHKRLQPQCMTDSNILNEKSIKEAAQQIYEIVN